MEIFANKTIRTALLILMVSASLALLATAVNLFSQVGAPSDINKIPTIAVSGTGKATAIPDVAEFSFTVDKTAATVAAAQNAASTLTNRALTTLQNAGVSKNDLQTTNYSISPHYTYSAQPTICPVGGCPPVRQVLDGYEVSQTINVKVETASTTGALLQTIGQMGITQVSGITFTENNPHTAQDEARAKAIADAEQKAQTLASQLGVRLVRIVSFQESNNTPQPIYQMATFATAASAAPSIPTGENTVTENVTITYEIE